MYNLSFFLWAVLIFLGARVASEQTGCSAFSNSKIDCGHAVGCTFCTDKAGHSYGCYNERNLSKLISNSLKCESNQPSATITTGVVVGTSETVKGGAEVASFKGIPYFP